MRFFYMLICQVCCITDGGIVVCNFLYSFKTTLFTCISKHFAMCCGKILEFYIASWTLHGEELMREWCKHCGNDAAKESNVANGLCLWKESGHKHSDWNTCYNEADGNQPFWPTMLFNCHHIFNRIPLIIGALGSNWVRIVCWIFNT